MNYKMENYWGYHLVLDCSGCDIVKMSDKNNVYSWIKSLVKDIDMDPIGEPNIEYTAGHDINKAGFTAIQIIVTSSITAHFIDNLGHIYLDVFSCKKFDQAVVENSMINYFGATKQNKHYLTRQAG